MNRNRWSKYKLPLFDTFPSLCVSMKAIKVSENNFRLQIYYNNMLVVDDYYIADTSLFQKYAQDFNFLKQIEFLQGYGLFNLLRSLSNNPNKNILGGM